MSSLAAVLLCGGDSRRMGRDKATLSWRSELLWQRQLATLHALEPVALFVSARRDLAWRPAEVEFVADAPPSRGPLSGLAAALARGRSTHLAVLAIDLPLMTPEHLTFLRSFIAPGVGVVPMIDGGAEPLAAIYPREAAGVFADALAGPNAALQPIIRKLLESGMLRAHEITTRDRVHYQNLNEPRDAESAGA